MSKLDLIWNISLVCPWDCEFCCTDAVHVKHVNDNIIAKEHSLTISSLVDSSLTQVFLESFPGVRPNIYDLALLQRQIESKEITLKDKFAVLDSFRGLDVKIDFAGGDPLACYENFLVISRASKIFGKENISITSTGHSLSRYGFEKISEIIGEFEFTFDQSFIKSSTTRPVGYNRSNLYVAERFSELGVKTKAQLPLANENIDKASIYNIYDTLNNVGISELLLLRTFPVGRGIQYLSKHSLTKSEMKSAIDYYFSLSRNGSTSVRLQCALKHFYNMGEGSNPCDAMKESFGINYQGKLLLSAWANNAVGKPLSDDFVLGSLVNTSFLKLSQGEKFKRFQRRSDENNGHCKIFSFTHGGRTEEAIFSQADPLYN